MLILDFGSQVTQLIARRLRESGVYCEIWPFTADPGRIRRLRAARHHPVRRPGQRDRRGVARARRTRCSRPACRCWASATASRPCARSSAARSQGSDHREFGRAFVDVDRATARCSDGVWAARRARAGLDEPRRPRDPPAARLPRGRQPARARRSPSSPTKRAASTA